VHRKPIWLVVAVISVIGLAACQSDTRAAPWTLHSDAEPSSADATVSPPDDTRLEAPDAYADAGETGVGTEIPVVETTGWERLPPVRGSAIGPVIDGKLFRRGPYGAESRKLLEYTTDGLTWRDVTELPYGSLVDEKQSASYAETETNRFLSILEGDRATSRSAFTLYRAPAGTNDFESLSADVNTWPRLYEIDDKLLAASLDELQISRDDGESWTEITPEERLDPSHFHPIAIADETIFVPGYGNELFVSSDFGRSWKTVEPTHAATTSLPILADAHCMPAGPPALPI
jgi:hypothetical protein